jgi:8-oxo-dGTP pyrophosphatase MutT (NUDIX family)
MKLLRCACLVAEQGDRLLLVRVRQNEHWYLPGGKIEEGESPEQALQRELMEELGISVDPESVRYLYTVRGPAYGQPCEVELVCFSAQWKNLPRPLGEISDVQWLHRQEQAKFAPAVQVLCSEFLGCSTNS